MTKLIVQLKKSAKRKRESRKVHILLANSPVAWPVAKVASETVACLVADPVTEGFIMKLWLR